MAVDYETSCRGKHRFSTRRDARRGRRSTRAEGPLTIYGCRFCGFYHLGHMPDVVRRGELDKDAWKGQLQ